VKNMDKSVVIIVSLIIICSLIGFTIFEITKPKLTDPTAQRIWAATHGTMSLTSDEAAKLIRSAIDTIKQK
jgi:hypothetical protein